MDTVSAYDVYASVYDSVKHDRSSTIDLIRGLINQHHPTTKQILELACGTGSVLKGLSTTYTVTGLDNSAAMLAHAKRKMPECTFYLADMTDFHLGQMFDTIYCIHNSINHLLSFAEWEALFNRVHAQLKPNGLFIFDLNTEERLELLTKGGIGVWPANNDYVLTKVGKHPEHKGHYNWEVRIFIQKDPYSFTYHPSVIEVSTYPLKRILGALGRRFTLADIVEIWKTNDPEEYGRMYIICRKA